MPYVRSDGASIHYLTFPEVPTKPSSMPAITFVHGGGGNAYGWLHQMPFFAAQGFYVIAFSVRGWGASTLDADDADNFSARNLASDVVAVLDAVGAEQTALVGHSIGGFYVARAAVEVPERLTHAIFSSTFYGLTDAPGEDHKSWITQYVNVSFGSEARDKIVDELRLALPPAALEAAHAVAPGAKRTRYPIPPDNFSPDFRAARPELVWFYDATNDSNRQVVNLGLKKRFKLVHAEGAVTPFEIRSRFTGPILFTTTACDAAVPWELLYHLTAQFEESAGNTQLEWFRGTLCHAPYLEDPEQYNCTLLNFLLTA